MAVLCIISRHITSIPSPSRKREELVIWLPLISTCVRIICTAHLTQDRKSNRTVNTRNRVLWNHRRVFCNWSGKLRTSMRDSCRLTLWILMICAHRCCVKLLWTIIASTTGVERRFNWMKWGVLWVILHSSRRSPLWTCAAQFKFTSKFQAMRTS